MWAVLSATGLSWEQQDEMPIRRYRLLCRRLVEDLKRRRNKEQGIMTFGDLIDGY